MLRVEYAEDEYEFVEDEIDQALVHNLHTIASRNHHQCTNLTCDSDALKRPNANQRNTLHSTHAVQQSELSIT